MDNLEGSIQQNIPNPGILQTSAEDTKDVINRSMKDIERAVEFYKIRNDGTINLLFCRDTDELIDLPAYALKDMIEVLVNTALKEEKKSRNFLKFWTAMQQLETKYNIFTKFNDLYESIKLPSGIEGFSDYEEQIRENSPMTLIVFKLFQFSDWFEEKPIKERAGLILKKDVINKTILETINPIRDEVRKYGAGSKIAIYGPDINLRKYKGYDFHRARLEKVIFDEAKRNYGNDDIFDFVENKNPVNLFRYLKGGMN